MGTELTGGASAPRWARDTAPQPKPHRPRCAGVSLGFPTPILFRGHRRKTRKETVQSAQVRATQVAPSQGLGDAAPRGRCGSRRGR